MAEASTSEGKGGKKKVKTAEALKEEGVLYEGRWYDYQVYPKEAWAQIAKHGKVVHPMSLNASNLMILNRDHSVVEAVQCITSAKDIFPGKVSVDIMFALPFQTCDLWREDLESILPLCDNHLSLYQLTLERGTQLFKNVKSGLITIPDDDVKAEMYEIAIDLLQQYGFHRYEISNFAKNFEAESIHNKAVWQGTQFIGIGPGAHSRVFSLAHSKGAQLETSSSDRKFIREARRNAVDPSSWLLEINAKGNSLRLCERQSTMDFLMEYIATSLRTTEGLNHERWWEISNRSLTDIISPSDMDTELIYFDNNGDLKATPKGLNVLDSILPNLINILQDRRTLIQY